MGLLLAGRIRPNATLTVKQQRASTDGAGGTVLTPVTVADDVPALVSQISGSRDGRFSSDVDTPKGSALSTSAYVGRQDVTLLVKTCPTMPWLVGLSLRVDSVAGHPPSQPTGRIDAAYRAQWSAFSPSS